MIKFTNWKWRGKKPKTANGYWRMVMKNNIMMKMVHMAKMAMVRRRRKHHLQSRVVDDDVCKIGIDGEEGVNDDVDGVMVDFVINWDVGQLIGDAEQFIVCIKNIKIFI